MQQATYQHGIRHNRIQFSLQLLQVFFVGLMIGSMRTVVPVLAETQFGLQDQFVLLASFVVVFGVVKAVMNLVAGQLSEHLGRRKVLLLGWLVALPVPFLIGYAQSWAWVVAATVLLGVNQGLAWSMALNSKLDLTLPAQRGLVNGLNEFFGYAAVGLAGWATAWLAEALGAQQALFVFSMGVVLLGFLSAWIWIVETRPWALAHMQHAPQAAPMRLHQVFWLASWESKPLFALNQAGLVEKFVDALVWVFWPLFFVAQGKTLVEAGGLIAIYAVTWGAGQLITGPLSDKIGRKRLIVWGMVLCGVSVGLVPQLSEPFWPVLAALSGVGMAMLYPTLGAAVADVSPADQRAAILGVYRFWRDFGYAVGALVLALFAQMVQAMEMAFYLTAVSMVLSAMLVQWRYTERRAV